MPIKVFFSKIFFFFFRLMIRWTGYLFLTLQRIIFRGYLKGIGGEVRKLHFYKSIHFSVCYNNNRQEILPLF